MFDKLKDGVNIPEETVNNFLDDFLIALYGSKEDAINELNKLKDGDYISDDNLAKLLKVPTLDTINDITETLIGNNGILNSVKNINSLNDICEESSKNMPQEEIPEILNVIDALETVSQKTMPITNNERYAFKVLEKKFSFKIKFSKEEIARELGISKKLFNKFLSEFYGNKFNNKRKLSFIEYIDIIRTFSLKKDEDTIFIHDNLQTYINRIEAGIIFKKKDLIDIDHSNYKRLKADLEKMYPIYSKLDKFPFSIAAEFMEHLEKNIENDIL